MRAHTLMKHQDEAVNWGGEFTSQIEKEKWVFTAAFLSLVWEEKNYSKTALLSLPCSKRSVIADEYFLTCTC